MSRNENRIRPSLLDRLTHETPRLDLPRSLSHDLKALKSSLWRDLTSLLNTNCSEREIDERYPEARNSILTYGLPDFASCSLKSQADQQKICRAIASAIRRFEPRLEKVIVTVDGDGVGNGGLRYSVEAVLRVDPVTEPIRFETLLEEDSRHFLIVGETR